MSHNLRITNKEGRGDSASLAARRGGEVCKVTAAASEQPGHKADACGPREGGATVRGQCEEGHQWIHAGRRQASRAHARRGPDRLTRPGQEAPLEVTADGSGVARV